MRAQELFEYISDRVYHSTSTRNAVQILSDGEFKLTSKVGSDMEEKILPKDFIYYLSLSRSPTSDYNRYVGNDKVMFNLDGRWLTQRYRGEPVDYWERMWLGTDRTREMEDRVFSNEPSIPITPIQSIHALIKEPHERRSSELRTLLLLAKQKGIPFYLYNNEQAWRIQNSRQRISVAQAKELGLLKGFVPLPKDEKKSFPLRDPLKIWLELLYRKSRNDLSKEADRLLYHIMYSTRFNPKEDMNLHIDMFNNRKPNETGYKSVKSIVSYMQSNNLKSTVDIVKHIKDRWSKIN